MSWLLCFFGAVSHDPGEEGWGDIHGADMKLGGERELLSDGVLAYTRREYRGAETMARGSGWYHEKASFL